MARVSLLDGISVTAQVLETTAGFVAPPADLRPSFQPTNDAKLGIPRCALPPPPLAGKPRLRDRNFSRLWRLGASNQNIGPVGPSLPMIQTTVPGPTELQVANTLPGKIEPREVLKRELGGRLVYLAENDFHGMRVSLGITPSEYFEYHDVMYANHGAITKNPMLERVLLDQMRLPRTEDLSADIQAGGLAKNIPGMIAGIRPPEHVYYASVARFETAKAEFADFVRQMNRGTSVHQAVAKLREIHASFLNGYGPAVQIYTRNGRRYLASAYLEDRIFEAIRDNTTSALNSAVLVFPASYWNSTMDQTRTNFLMTLIDIAAHRFFHSGSVQVQDTFGQDPGKTARVNNVLLSLQFQSDTPEKDLEKFLRSLPRLIQGVIDEYYATIPRKERELDQIMDQIAGIFDELSLDITAENISRIKDHAKRKELRRLFDEVTIVQAELDNAKHFLEGHVIRKGHRSTRYLLLDEHGVPLNLDKARLDLISGAYVTLDLTPYFSREDIFPAEIQKLSQEARSRTVSLAEYNASRNGEREKAVIGETDVEGRQIPEKLLFPDGQRLSAAKMYAGLAEARRHHANEHYTATSKFTRLGWDRVEALATEMQALCVDHDVNQAFAALESHFAAGRPYHQIAANDPAQEFLALLDEFFSGPLSDDALVAFQGLGGFPSMRHFRHLAGTGKYSLAGKISTIREKLERKLKNRGRLSDRDIEELREIVGLLPGALDFMKEAGVESNGITVPEGLHTELTLRAAQRQYQRIRQNTEMDITDKNIISVGVEASGFQNYERARRTKRHARDTYADRYKTLSQDVAEYLGRQHGGAHVEVVITAQGDEVGANFIGHDSQGRALTYDEIAEAYQVVKAQKLPGETARTEKFGFNGAQERLDLYEIGLTDRGRVVHALRHPRNPDLFYVLEDLTRVDNNTSWVTVKSEDVTDWKFAVPEFGELPGMEIVVNDGTNIRHLLVAQHPAEAGQYYVVKDFHTEFWGEKTSHEWITIAPKTIQAASSKHFTLARKKLGLRLAMSRYQITNLRLDAKLDDRHLERDTEELNDLREALLGYDNVIKYLIKEALRRGETPPLFYEYQRR